MNELYPIGSLVTIKNTPTPLMIMGYLPIVKERVYDYIGVPYPTGLISEKSTMAFDHVLIEELVSKGYEDEDCKVILQAIPRLVSGVVAMKVAKEEE